MKILLVGSKTKSLVYTYNYLNTNNIITSVVVEDKISILKKLKFRLKKFGLFKTIDQFIFVLIIPKLLKFVFKNYLDNLLCELKFNNEKIPKSKISYIKSVNSNLFIDLINKDESDVVLLCGTRIIRPYILSSISKQIINIHAGITPDYRGVHGMYWALVNKDFSRSGVTLHLVDKGIDTGEVIAQSVIESNKNDSFVSFPLKQLSQGLELFEIFLKNNTKEKKIASIKSKQYFHPGFIEYVLNYFKFNVK